MDKMLNKVYADSFKQMEKKIGVGVVFELYALETVYQEAKIDIQIRGKSIHSIKLSQIIWKSQDVYKKLVMG